MDHGGHTIDGDPWQVEAVETVGDPGLHAVPEDQGTRAASWMISAVLGPRPVVSVSNMIHRRAGLLAHFWWIFSIILGKLSNPAHIASVQFLFTMSPLEMIL